MTSLARKLRQGERGRRLKGRKSESISAKFAVKDASK